MPKEREAVQKAVDSVPITRSWKFEDTPASSQPVQDAYLSKVRTCDIFLLVLAYEYSKEVAREYKTAIESKRPTLVFIHNGPRDEQQDALVASIGNKYARYTTLEDLQRLVTSSIWDELIRSYRNTLPPNAAVEAIKQMPPPRRVENIASYFITGLANETQAKLFKVFGAKDVPSDLESLYPDYEPLPVINVVEVNAAANAIRNANIRAQAATGDKEQAFIREMQKEALEIASHYLKRQSTNTPEPSESIPGIDYYLWGIERNYARIVKLLRLEGKLKPFISITRKSPEVMFRNAEHFVKVMTIFQEAKAQAGDDLEEMRRILSVQATLMDLEDEGGENER